MREGTSGGWSLVAISVKVDDQDTTLGLRDTGQSAWTSSRRCGFFYTCVKQHTKESKPLICMIFLEEKMARISRTAQNISQVLRDTLR